MENIFELYTVPVALVVVAWLTGLIVGKLLLPKIKQALVKNKWQEDDIAVNAIKGMSIL